MPLSHFVAGTRRNRVDLTGAAAGVTPTLEVEVGWTQKARVVMGKTAEPRAGCSETPGKVRDGLQ